MIVFVAAGDGSGGIWYFIQQVCLFKIYFCPLPVLSVKLLFVFAHHCFLLHGMYYFDEESCYFGDDFGVFKQSLFLTSVNE